MIFNRTLSEGGSCIPLEPGLVLRTQDVTCSGNDWGCGKVSSVSCTVSDQGTLDCLTGRDDLDALVTGADLNCKSCEPLEPIPGYSAFLDPDSCSAVLEMMGEGEEDGSLVWLMFLLVGLCLLGFVVCLFWSCVFPVETAGIPQATVVVEESPSRTVVVERTAPPPPSHTVIHHHHRPTPLFSNHHHHHHHHRPPPPVVHHHHHRPAPQVHRGGGGGGGGRNKGFGAALRLT